MRVASLKIKNYAENMVFIDSGNLRKKTLYLLLSVLSALAVVYVISLSNVIWNVLERKALEKRAVALESEVTKLQSEYLSAAQKINLSLARDMGFRETPSRFVSRKTLFSASVQRNEI